MKKKEATSQRVIDEHYPEYVSNKLIDSVLMRAEMELYAGGMKREGLSEALAQFRLAMENECQYSDAWHKRIEKQYFAMTPTQKRAYYKWLSAYMNS